MEGTRLNIPFRGILTSLSTSILELTTSQSKPIETITSPNRSFKGNGTQRLTIYLSRLSI